MINSSQTAVLWIDDDKDNMVLVVDFNIVINGVDRFVSADFTCECNYSGGNPIFNFFIQRRSGDIHMTLRNNMAPDGESLKRIKLEKAMINTYRENYDSQQQSSEERNVYFAVFSIHADTVDLGDASFTAAF